MNINEIEKIIPKEKILQNVQMKKYTSYKIERKNAVQK